MATASDDPSTDSQRALRVLAWIVVIGSLGFLGMHYWKLFRSATPFEIFDDSYMFARYGRNLLAGRGLAWNPDGVQTYGPTSLLYVLLVAGTMLVTPFQPGLLLLLLSFTLGWAAIFLIGFTCYRVAKSSVLRVVPVMAALIVVTLPLKSLVEFHLVTGMDTTLALLCNALLILAALRFTYQRGRTRMVLLIGSAYLTFFARPDNGIYAILFPLLAICLLMMEDRVRNAAIFLGGIGVLVLFDSLIKHRIFGSPLPLSAYVKATGFYQGYYSGTKWNPMDNLAELLQTVLPFVLIGIFTAQRRHWRIAMVFLLPVAITSAYYFDVVQIMGFKARYYVPSIPFFVVGGVILLDNFLTTVEGGYIAAAKRFVAGDRLMLRIIIAALVLLCLPEEPSARLLAGVYYHFFMHDPPKPLTARSDPTDDHSKIVDARGQRLRLAREAAARQPQGYGRRRVGRILEHLPAGATIAASEVGYIGAVSPDIAVIDLAGLNDVYIAHNGFSTAYLLSRQPDFIWLPHIDYVGIRAQIISDAAFRREFLYFPEVLGEGVAVRKDSPLRDEILQLVQDQWVELVPGTKLDDFLLDSAEPP